MLVEENSKLNKILYKVQLYSLKVIPMSIALLHLLNTILSYFNIDLEIFSYIGGISLLPILYLYISSYTFKFCEYHRMFLHYTVVTDIVNIIDLHYNIPLNNAEFICLHLAITGIALFLILYLYVNKRNKRVIIKDNR